jgi:predicted TIM-barrel fold metal-dependent hydrolase
MTTRYEPAIDLDAIVAIDVHTHVEADGHGHFSLDDELMDASAAYFKADQLRTPTLDDIAAHYRERSMAAVVFTVDAETATGHPALSSEEIAEGAARNNDVLIPFGSVDPRKGAAAVERARVLVAEHGVRGFKLHPSLQAFAPNDPAYYPLYEAFSELGVVALFHTGQTGIGAGLPGGRGIKLRYSDPMLIDDVAADFPELQIVMALVRQLSTLLRRKVLFGSDFPVLTPDRWVASFDELDVKDEAKPLILKENAVRLLGLAQ